MKGIFIPVASGTVTQANMKLSVVDGGATASGGAFVDFTATTVSDKTLVASGTVTQANTRIATVATGALLELVGVDLSAHLGKKIVIKSGGKRIEGYIGAAGGEALDADIIVYGDFADDTKWNLQQGQSIAGGKLVWTESYNVFTYRTVAAAAVTGTLFKVLHTTDSIAAGNEQVWFGGVLSTIRNTPGTYTDYITSAGSDTVALYAPGTVTTAQFDNYTAQKVTDLAVTGAKIYTTSALSVNSWAYQDTGYDPNASAGVTYEIYSVTPLTNHLGHLLRIKSLTSGQVLQGFIKSAGTGETTTTLGSDDMADDGTADWTKDAAATLTFDTDHYLYANSEANNGVFSPTGVTWVAGGLYKGQVQAKNGTASSKTLEIYFGTGKKGSITTSAVNQTLSVYWSATVGAANRKFFIGSPQDLDANLQLQSFLSYQVITPSATGSTIVSTKGGVTYNWSQKPTTLSTFLNDAAGYSYEILKVLDAPVIATDTITAGNALIDLTTANAFAAPVGVDLSAYQDSKHILTLYDASGYAALALISDTAPSGEALSAEIATGTLTINKLYKITATEVNHFGTGYIVDRYFTSLGTETCDASNKVVENTMPAATGVLLESAAGIRGYIYKHPSFNPNGALTYKILYIGD